MDKKKIICDTNIFIQVLSGDDKIISAVEFIRHENILMTSITALELCKGASNKKEMKSISSFINVYSILSLNTKSSILAIELLKKYSLSHNLSLPDSLIAAISITESMILLEVKKRYTRSTS
jgi:predicted nucleic acid-binding protein